MKKVLLVTVACLLASHAVQAQDDQVREAAPIGLVGEPWPPGTIASTLLGSASLAYPTDESMPVEGDLTQLPPVPYATPSLPFMSAYGDPTKPPFVADPLKPTVEGKPPTSVVQVQTRN